MGQASEGGTRTAQGMARALEEYPEAVVLIGSAPTALVVRMPVGFVGVPESKRRLAASPLPQIRLEGTRGGAGLAASSVNALLSRAWLDRRSQGCSGRFPGRGDLARALG